MNEATGAEVCDEIKRLVDAEYFPRRLGGGLNSVDMKTDFAVLFRDLHPSHDHVTDIGKFFRRLGLEDPISVSNPAKGESRIFSGSIRGKNVKLVV